MRIAPTRFPTYPPETASMYFLARTISAHTGPDLFLGLFTDRERAEEARRDYLRSIAAHDRWREQAYRTVDPDADVQIREIGKDATDGPSQRVYLVTAHIEAMGQITRRPLAIFSSRELADRFAEALEAGDWRDPGTPNWCDVDEIEVDTLLPG